MTVILLMMLVKVTLSSEFTANTTSQYKDMTLHCADNSDCILNCYDTWACENATIIGPFNATLTINCNNKNGGGMTCYYMTIYAQNSSRLILNDYGYQNGAQWDLYGTDIYTPLINNSQYSPNTIIKCGVVDPNNPHEQFTEICSSQMNIFSQNGWQSVLWSYVAGKSWTLSDYASQSTMYCGMHYSNYCTGWKRDGIYYRCNDEQSVCDYQRIGTLNPTQKPIISPRPTYRPTERPIIGINPTYRPTQRPTGTSDTGDYEDCVEITDLFDGNGLIKIEIDIKQKKQKITLNGPKNEWFGVGFGGHSMSGIYSIIVSGIGFDVNTRVLSEGNNRAGILLDEIFDSIETTEFGDLRFVSIVRSWGNNGNSNIYDFTNFFECVESELPIIWAKGADLTFGYHMVKNNELSLVSCQCGNGNDPATNPTLKPTEDIVTNSGTSAKLSKTNYFMFFVLFLIGLIK